MRFGLGPVFACEKSIASRRWQNYAARSLLLSSLLVAMATVALSSEQLAGGGVVRHHAALGRSYFYAIIGVELAVVLFAAPAATAGAICLDRARGTLAHVLATQLSDAEIVLGKLAARLAPILALAACTWPVMAISSLLGGIDPLAVTLAFAIILAIAIFGCSLALLLSVWARRTHDVVLAVYVFWALLLLAWPIWYGLTTAGVLRGPSQWLLVVNPFYLAFAPYAAPNQIGIEHYLGFFTATLAGSAISVLVTIWRMRPVACQSDGRAHSGIRFGLLARLGRALPGPSLDGNPVLWREWHRLRPSKWMVAVGLSIWTTTTVTCAICAYWIWRNGIGPSPGLASAPMAGVAAYLILILFGLLLLSAIAPTSMSEERQHGSLDVLVVTPLSTRAIWLGKWWGTFRLVPLLAIGPGLVGLALATARYTIPKTGVILAGARNYSLGACLAALALLVATILIYGAVFTSLGLALATWIKRQSRAIAASVSIFVLLTIAWPILLIAGLLRGRVGVSMMSPIFSTASLGGELAMRSLDFGYTLWWVAFWDAAALATAVGLCWLAVRTFDGAFGRVPEQRRTSHWMADVVVVVAGVTAAACLVRAIASWVHGVLPHGFPGSEEDFTLFGFFLIELVALILLPVVAAVSAPTEEAVRGAQAASSSARSIAAIVIGKWWRVFCLALLLAIAPGLVVLALATSRDFWPVVTVEDTSFRGNKVVLIISTTPSESVSAGMRTGDRNDAEVQAAIKEASVRHPALPFGDRARDAGLLMITFLAHAAAATSAGLLLGLWIKHRRSRIAAAAALPLFVVVAWLVGVHFVVDNYEIAERLYALSPLWVADHLMEPLLARRPHSSGLLGWIAGWDAAMMVFAAGMLSLAVRAVKRRAFAKDGFAIRIESQTQLEGPLVDVG